MTRNTNFTFNFHSIRFDETYTPSDNTRITTNFANLARGSNRQENLRNALTMINKSFNARAYWDNPQGDRYSLELDIISIDMNIDNVEGRFPLIEILKTTINDHHNNERISGMVGNNFSSYVRDYDFSVLLPEHNKGQDKFSIPNDFGELHGQIFQYFVKSDTYKNNFNKLPVICISVSDNKVYQRTNNYHPILGYEYQPNEPSLTEQYFKKMGLNTRYFMPPNSVAPLSFYFFGDLLSDYTNLEIISLLSTMETFQKIFRPEIYNANSAASIEYKPNLKNKNYSITQVGYDREERTTLAIKQGKFAEQNFVKPYKTILDQWLVENRQ